MSPCYQTIFLSGLAYYMYTTTANTNDAQELVYVKQKIGVRLNKVLLYAECSHYGGGGK